MGGRRNGGIYKERASKDRGKEKGNEELKGRWSACGIGEFENGKSGKKKRGKERKGWGRRKLERVVVGVAEVCMINLSDSWELIPGRQIRGEERHRHIIRGIFHPLIFPADAAFFCLAALPRNIRASGQSVELLTWIYYRNRYKRLC